MVLTKFSLYHECYLCISNSAIHCLLCLKLMNLITGLFLDIGNGGVAILVDGSNLLLTIILHTVIRFMLLCKHHLIAISPTDFGVFARVVH